MARWTRRVGWFNGILSFCSVASVVILGFQVNETQMEQRPWITVYDDPAPQSSSVRIIIKNIGKIPTSKLVVDALATTKGHELETIKAECIAIDNKVDINSFTAFPESPWPLKMTDMPSSWLWHYKLPVIDASGGFSIAGCAKYTFPSLFQRKYTQTGFYAHYITDKSRRIRNEYVYTVNAD